MEIDPESTFADFIFEKWGSDQLTRYEKLSEEQKELLRRILSKTEEIKQNEGCLIAVKELLNDHEDACSNRAVQIVERAADVLDSFLGDFGKVEDIVLMSMKKKGLEKLFEVEHKGFEAQYASFKDEVYGAENVLRYKSVLSQVIGVPMSDLSEYQRLTLEDISIDKNFVVEVLNEEFSLDPIKEGFLEILERPELMERYECNVDEYVVLRGKDSLKETLKMILEKAEASQEGLSEAEKNKIEQYSQWYEEGTRLPIKDIIDLVGQVSVIAEAYGLDECECGNDKNKKKLITQLTKNEEGKKILAENFVNRLCEEGYLEKE